MNVKILLFSALRLERIVGELLYRRKGFMLGFALYTFVIDNREVARFLGVPVSLYLYENVIL